MTKRRKGSTGQVIGGILADFDQWIFRTTPPTHELVHHARPDAPVAAADGGKLLVSLPDDEPPVPGSPDVHPGEEARPVVR